MYTAKSDTSSRSHSSNYETLPAIDLFSGCGGLSLGLKQAGFDVRAAVEIDPKASKTYRDNHPEVQLFQQDIRTINPRDLLSSDGVIAGEVALLAGCPPCQVFSRLRTRNKPLAVADARNDLIDEFLRIAKFIKPRAIMLENVPALLRDDWFYKFRKELESLGYSATFAILDAADYEVPQRRKRLIYLSSLEGTPPVAPIAKRRKTVRDAISSWEETVDSCDTLHSLPERRSKAMAELIRLIPEDGGSRRDLGEAYQLNCHLRSSGFSDTYGRMSWDKVAPTITSGCHNPSKGRFLHPSKHRAITLREAALLQGFPPDYMFNTLAGKEAIALMIGNALPPPFIKAQAISVRKTLTSLGR